MPNCTLYSKSFNLHWVYNVSSPSRKGLKSLDLIFVNIESMSNADGQSYLFGKLFHDFLCLSVTMVPH